MGELADSRMDEMILQAIVETLENRKSSNAGDALDLLSRITDYFSEFEAQEQGRAADPNTARLWKEEGTLWEIFGLVVEKDFAQAGRANEYELLKGVTRILEKRKETETKLVPKFGSLPTTNDTEELCKKAFFHIRCGDLLAGANVFTEAGIHWRSASILGSGLTFRKACAETRNVAGIGKWEAALYGLLCGDVECVLPVCEDWYDICWLHFRVMCDNIELQMSLGSYDPLVMEDENPEMVFSRINSMSTASFEVYESTRSYVARMLELILMRKYLDILKLTEILVYAEVQSGYHQFRLYANVTIILDILLCITSDSREILGSAEDDVDVNSESLAVIYIEYVRVLAQVGYFMYIPDFLSLLKEKDQVATGCDVLMSMEEDEIASFLSSPSADVIRMEEIVFLIIRRVCFTNILEKIGAVGQDRDEDIERRIRGFSWIDVKSLPVHDTLYLFNELCRVLLAYDCVESASRLYDILHEVLSISRESTHVHPIHKNELNWFLRIISAKTSEQLVGSDDYEILEESLKQIANQNVAEFEFQVDARIYEGSYYMKLGAEELKEILGRREELMGLVRRNNYPYAIRRLAELYLQAGEYEKLTNLFIDLSSSDNTMLENFEDVADVKGVLDTLQKSCVAMLSSGNTEDLGRFSKIFQINY